MKRHLMTNIEGHRFTEKEANNWRTLEKATENRYMRCPVCGKGVVCSSSHLRVAHNLIPAHRRNVLKKFKRVGDNKFSSGLR